MIILMRHCHRRFDILTLVIVLVILFSIEPSKCEIQNPKPVAEESNKIVLLKGTNNNLRHTFSPPWSECKCSTPQGPPKRCRMDEDEETIVDDMRNPCCKRTRCVCKRTCPTLDYDICTDGFRPQRQKAGSLGAAGSQCCDTIICVSASSNDDDDLTISVKQGGLIDDIDDDDDDEATSNEFYIDDENALLGNMNTSSDENMINLNSFQYDSNQVIDDDDMLMGGTTKSFEATRDPATSTTSVAYYDDQVKITVKNDNNNAVLLTENEYYLDEKEYGHLMNMTSEEDICTRIDCKADSFAIYKQKLTCPEDSLVKQADDLEQHCCQLSAKCECSKCEAKPSKSWCKMAGSNFEPVLVRKGELIPGKCCDMYICHSSNFTCTFNGAFYSHNSEWKLNACTQCRCDAGYITCKKIECALDLDCDIKAHISADDDECCPVCTGECRSDATGRVYKSNETWLEDDDCTECRCVNGRKQCVAELCQSPLLVTCPNRKRPVKKPGVCCPVCEDDLLVGGDDEHRQRQKEQQLDDTARIPWNDSDETISVTPPPVSATVEQMLLKQSNYPPHCGRKLANLKCRPRDLESCAHGVGVVELDGNRCPTCRCATRPPQPCAFRCDDSSTKPMMPLSDRLCTCPSPSERSCNNIDCMRSCTHGYVKGLDGCDMCICKNENLNEDEDDNDDTSEEADDDYCRNPDTGETIANGNVWFDGCRQCVCQRGVQYCSLISCTKSSSSCPNSVLKTAKPSACCPVCPIVSNETSMANTTICQAGSSVVDRTLWSFDKCTKCMCQHGSGGGGDKNDHAALLLSNVNSCPPVACARPLLLDSDACCPRCPPSHNPKKSPAAAAAVDSNVVRLASISSRSQQQQLLWSCVDSKERYREHGAAWKETDCLHCICLDGDVKCFDHEPSCPRIAPDSCRLVVKRKGDCCSQCLDPYEQSLPYNLSNVYLDRSFFASREAQSDKSSALSNKILIVVITLAVILLVLFLVMSMCLVKILSRNKNKQHAKTKKRQNTTTQKQQPYQPAVPNKNQYAAPHERRTSVHRHSSAGGGSRPGSELIVRVDDNSPSSVRVSTRNINELDSSPQLHHVHHQLLQRNSYYSNSTNRLTPGDYMSLKNTAMANSNSGGELSKPLLGGGTGPKKYVISRTNLNTAANNSGSEISEVSASTNNDDNSKSTVLTTDSATPVRPSTTYLPPVNNQICYF